MDTMTSKLRALALAEPIFVVGMGASGHVALDLLREAGYDAIGLDERLDERRIEKRNFDDPQAFAGAGTLVVSPGVDRRRAAFTHSYAQQINDIELFARLNDKPVLAVTGSNGKSTVVTLLAQALNHAGHKAKLCGNIGRPVLDALFDGEAADCYVIELSSYQLELCPSLYPRVAAVLNVTPDHLDRYDDFAAYAAAKANLVRQSSICILNGDDEACVAMAEDGQNIIYYGTSATLPNRVEGGKIWLHGHALLETARLRLGGAHNHANILCTLLMLEAYGVAPQQVLSALETFAGLPHRMQLVSEENGVRWYDDSKATNIGAAAAALAGIDGAVVLIAGGVGKNQDFSLLARELQQANLRGVLLIGVDNRDMAAAFTAAGIAFEDCGTMDKAVARARALAQAGDSVLLAPATASFDQYSGYDARGDAFAYEVTSTCR
ncbi:UDP-N-acetylmuramoylalanine--D-glutamate ligase [Cardiobacterium hominis]|uniref:UDP-N-acetylmuramoylalanine--D-glutamate ligase n=1 Tax=Cardiobacterium hominis (strain ATCC 15826 / DSM 8339 / NCTC 10426 / 6573) TaxID=638300 RepID=C8ND41_CARH6|nr:UDP-N-acetylmuramoyl-L-alanine--D-glutamate ligase [Cardiobacterium hominis]EEV87434.1 UDP-N-acetylmuramoyl-L-alanine--D-glutamate ligase [Cardiobacterium hominis ATCC 15826]VEG78215.1 UDP-N-acetylmuramoylalanine--D-glutamate ligase [Cardiobacterium hominis]